MSLARDIADLGAVTSRLDTVGASSGALSNRNLVINGAMQVYQRGAGTYTNNNLALDRWKFAIVNTDNAAGTITQVADAPTGFATSLKLTTTTAESAWAADEYSHLSQLIEAQNLQSLGWGTSSAKPLTLSFYVKSSVTGTFAVGIYKADNTAVISNKTYTIDSANTWEYKTVTFTANTTNDAINNDNGIGFYLNFHLAAGSNMTGGGSLTDWTNYGGDTFWANGQATNVLYTTNSSTWQLTGVQLEVGSQSTDFEHRSAGDQLQSCQRYFYKETYNTTGPFACQYVDTNRFIHIFHPTTMRAIPTSTTTYGGGVNGTEYQSTTRNFKAFFGTAYNSSSVNHLQTSYQADAEL